jgi:protein O-GlcNAc transferase
MLQPNQKISEAFGRAVAAYEAGRLGEAERLCELVLTDKDDFFDAIYLLAVIQSALGRKESALKSFERALTLRPGAAAALNERGMTLHELKRYDEAVASYDRALAARPDYALAQYRRGNALHELKRHDEALASYDRAISLRPDFANAHANRGAALLALRRYEDALASYDRALGADPNFAEGHYNRGNALLAMRRFGEAVASYDRALALRPRFAEALLNRGIGLQALGRFEEAIAAYDRALALQPNYAEALNNRGYALSVLGQYRKALVDFDRALAVRPDFAEALYNRGNALTALTRFQEAIASYDRALAIRPDDVSALDYRGIALRSINRWREAGDSYRRALAIRPDDPAALFGSCLAELPVLYADEAEIASRRAAYRSRLDALHGRVQAMAAPGALADAVGLNQPFYLAYQGCNDRELQARYGSLVCRVMAARYPPAALAPPPRADEPVRVGIVSGYFFWHSVWKIPIKGWVTQLERGRFRVFGYHTSSRKDAVTKTASAACDRFVEGLRSTLEWREAISSDAPHVLLYPDIGMDPVSAELAAQRLAPVQCVSLGHPNTTGFPTIDYFLSSALMEPANAQEHYTETLVNLPNLAVYYEPHATEPASRGRADYGLRPTSTIFWCGQSLFKYLPQFDQVFARIAAASPDCQFAFIEFPHGPNVTALFKERLARAFAAVGLRADDHCVFLPRLDRHQFVAAAGLCDVVLDSIGWSGFNSTLESLSHDLPIVTMAGPMLRGRHTTAILTMMGVTETISETVDDYVRAAVRLAQDASWRMAIKQKIAANKQRVYRDRTCITALENFLDQVARRARSAP